MNYDQLLTKLHTTYASLTPIEIATILDAHLAQHPARTSAPPPLQYTCVHCGAIFGSKKAVSQHRAVHQSPGFKCASCEPSFKRKGDLTRHARVHGDVGRVVCDGVEGGPCGPAGCGLSFTRRDSLLKHWKAVVRKERVQLMG